MDYPLATHTLLRAFGVRDALYLDANAWSALAKGNVDRILLADWLERTNTVIVITRFSIGELAKDDRLAVNVADLIESLNVIFVDLGTHDLDGRQWHLVPYEEILSLKPTDAAAKRALLSLLQHEQIRKTMATIRSDAAIWESAIEHMVQQRSKWSWSDFDTQLVQFVRHTCMKCNRTVNEKGLTDNSIYVGVKLAFGVIYQRYFLNAQPFRPSDYVDYLHASDMPYFKIVVTERGLCAAIKEVQRRLPGLGPAEVHNLNWFEGIKRSP